MARFHIILSFIFISFFSVFVCTGSQAQETVVVEKHEIISPAPKSSNCTTVPAHWEGNVWIDTQTVCSYTNRTEGVAWIQDYWACTAFNTTTSECTAWEYRPGHWVSTLP